MIGKHQFTGIDSGLVDTGIVSVQLDFEMRGWARYIRTVPGPGHPVNKQSVEDAAAETGRIASLFPGPTFIEAYKPRHSFSTTGDMSKLVTLTHRAVLDSDILLNTGVKKVVTPSMLKLLNLWEFPGNATHHQDLRSAARIGIYGALKNDLLNEALYLFITEQLDSGGTRWREF